jgi:hypothetical protein
MGMKTKCITTGCATCPNMKVNDNSQMVCHWSQENSKGKVLVPQKGKKPLECRLMKYL